ncbi:MULTISPECIES: hypothetical protein [Methylomonas]|uniref:Uncharacterized protein n=1 Tax=Methylomonas koyamae TaxID=702114 RepID=A0A177NQ14_9GAMM|nr:hypothetical protein [Methylomonas koyamae]OAI19634.1 hypothetical protein A1355_03800 [Methylomonas koyamae]
MMENRLHLIAASADLSRDMQRFNSYWSDSRLVLVISAGIAEIQTPRTDRSLPSKALDACVPADMTALLKSCKAG